MSDNSRIEWTDATWSVVTGCRRMSEGCRHCYAERLAATRLRHMPFYTGLTKDGRWTGHVRLNESVLTQPLRWQRPRRIFVASMGDLFHGSVPWDYVDRVFAVMALSPQHTFQVLTKRSDRMAMYLNTPGRWGAICAAAYQVTECRFAQAIRLEDYERMWPLSNVWLGVSVEDKEAADDRIPNLLRSPAHVRFLSMEPLLGPVSFRWMPYFHQATGESYRQYLERTGSVNHLESLRGIHWVIVGGESGPRARIMHPDWVRTIRDQCAEAGVAFLFKQWGEWHPLASPEEADAYPTAQLVAGPDISWIRIGKKAAGRRLDGREHDEYPSQSTLAPGALTPGAR